MHSTHQYILPFITRHWCAVCTEEAAAEEGAAIERAAVKGAKDEGANFVSGVKFENRRRLLFLDSLLP